MKGSLLLAEAATAHQDGTVSVLRAGITHVWGTAVPINFGGVMVVRIEPDVGDQGPHGFDLKVLDEDGATILPPLAGRFDAPKGGGSVSFILGVGLSFPRFGRFVFVLRIDNVQSDTWIVTTKKPTSATPPTFDQGQAGEP